MHTLHLTNGRRRGVIATAMVAALALAGCSSAGAGPSTAPSPSASPSAATIASDVPLDDQLYDALRAGDAALTAAVLEAGVDVDGPLAHGSTALGIAVTRNDPQLVAAVLAANPDLAATDARGLPVLKAACVHGVSGEVVQLLLDAGADPFAASPDEVGSLAIHECAYSGSVDAIDVLLDNGMEVDQRQTVYGATPLIVAAWQGHGELVTHLLELGADPTLTTDDGATARDWAEVGGHEGAVALLINAGG